MTNKRDNIVSLIVGGRGRRKTSLLKETLWAKAATSSIVIVDTFDNPVWRDMGIYVNGNPLNQSMAAYKIPIINADQLYKIDRGIKRIFNSDTDELLNQVQTRCRNTTVVIEDATRFLEGNLSEDVKRFVLDTKQTNVDLIMVFHSLTDTPPKLGRWSDYLTLFKTQEQWTSGVANKFSNPAVEKIFNQVNQAPDPFIHRTVCLRA